MTGRKRRQTSDLNYWPSALHQALSKRADADLPRFVDELWKLTTPIDDEGVRELPDELVKLAAQLEVAISALNMIATNTLDGGLPADKPTARAAFAMRMLAGVALLRIGHGRSPDNSERPATRFEAECAV